MITKDALLTLKEAAAILRVKDTRTVVTWGHQGRFLLIGTRKNTTVNLASLNLYTEGRSAWQSQNDASLEPEEYAPSTGAQSRLRCVSRLKGSSQGVIAFNPERKATGRQKR
ncbi:MAG: hypothetical protein M3R61_20325 [Chloroflexota bacterium]|nr:hypothetical protein [Chloroflexota bacterium]